MTLPEIRAAIGIEPFDESEAGLLYCGDCLEVMQGIPDGAVDCVVSDPPYGIDYDTSGDKFKNGLAYQKVEGDSAPFDPRPLLKQFYGIPIILWGGNCFANMLPNHPGWLAWIKVHRNNTKIRQAEAEFAWTNFVSRSQCFRSLWTGNFRDLTGNPTGIHPTMKPVQLMAWCIELCGDCDLILDPFAGSGTTLVAAKQLGRRYIGIEISEKYCEIARDRLRQEELF